MQIASRVFILLSAVGGMKIFTWPNQADCVAKRYSRDKSQGPKRETSARQSLVSEHQLLALACPFGSRP